MFSRRRRKKPRRCSSRSASGAGAGPAPLVMKRSYQSRATGRVRIERCPIEITVRAEAADSLIAARLVDAMVTEMDQLYEQGPGRGVGSGASPSDFSPPDGAFLVIYADGKPVAGGGLKRDDDGVAEIKRMYVAPAARRQGLGRRLLEELEDEGARARLRARSGSTRATRQPHAQAMYERAGYHPIENYNGNSMAVVLGREDPAVTAFVLTLIGAALACGLEMLEALAIVLAVGSTRRWRDAVIGAVGAVVLLAVVVVAVGPLLLARLPLEALQGRDRDRAAAVRARVAAQGRAAARRAARRSRTRSRSTSRSARRSRRWTLPAPGRARLAGADRRRQGRAAGGRRGRADRGRARRGPDGLAPAVAGAALAVVVVVGDRLRAAPAADAAAGVAPQVRGRRRALVVRRLLPRRGARRRLAAAATSRCSTWRRRCWRSPRRQIATLAREPVTA